MRLLVVTATIALAGVFTQVTPTEGAVSDVSVTVSCRSNPEKVTIRNNRAGAITITSVGSTYQPRSGEPYHVNKRLDSGRSITYRFGTGAGANKLTNQFIFDNERVGKGHA